MAQETKAVVSMKTHRVIEPDLAKISVRLPAELKRAIIDTVEATTYKSISDLVRTVVKGYLELNGWLDY